MQKKEIKGYITLSVAAILVLSACSSKPTTKAPVPTAPPVQSINPNDLNIPGITDTPGTGTTPTDNISIATAPPTTDPGTVVVPTPDPAVTVAPTTDPAVTVAPTTDPAVTATPTADPAVTATPTTAPSSTVISCEAKITGDLNALSGNASQLTAKNQCSDGTTKDDTFSWSSSDVTVATVDATGKVNALKAGTTNITASSNQNTSIKSSVQFKSSATCSISLSGDLATNTNLGFGSAKQLTATVGCSDGTSNTSNVTWTTSDSSVATVSTSGLVEAKKKGNVKITATYKSDSSINAFVDITVNDPYGNEVKTRISENKLHLPNGIDVRNGKIYVTNFDTVNADEGEVIVYDTSGAQISKITGSTLDLLPTSITAVVSDGSRVFVTNRTRANQASNNIYSFDTAGQGRLNAGIGLASSTDLKDMAIDPTTKSLYVANGLGYVTKVNYDGTGAVVASAQQIYFINNVNPAGICTDNFGNIYIVNTSTNPTTISKYGKDGADGGLTFNSKGTNSTGPEAASIYDVAYDGNKGIIYALAKSGGSNVILRYDSDGKFVKSFGSDAGMINPKAIAVSSDGTIYVTDWGVVSATNDNKGIVHQFSAGK
jgi:hypothetical protein